MNDPEEPLSQPSLQSELYKIDDALRKWRSVKQENDPLPDDFPESNKGALMSSVVLFFVLVAGTSLTPLLHAKEYSIAWNATAVVVLVAAISLLIILPLGVFRISTGQFWKALYLTFTNPTGDYPFGPLRRRLEHDFQSSHILERFDLSVLEVAVKRLEMDEADLRERLASLAGAPSVLFSISLVAGTYAAWQNFTLHSGIATQLIAGGSALGVALGAMATWYRVLLLELSRCRALVILTIAQKRLAPSL